jgi:hypothetical protein
VSEQAAAAASAIGSAGVSCSGELRVCRKRGELRAYACAERGGAGGGAVDAAANGRAGTRGGLPRTEVAPALAGVAVAVVVPSVEVAPSMAVVVDSGSGDADGGGDQISGGGSRRWAAVD